MVLQRRLEAHLGGLLGAGETIAYQRSIKHGNKFLQDNRILSLQPSSQGLEEHFEYAWFIKERVKKNKGVNDEVKYDVKVQKKKGAKEVDLINEKKKSCWREC